MKTGWQSRSLGDLCNVIGGGTPPKDKPEYYSGDIPWATVRDMRAELITETEFKVTPRAVKSSATNVIPGGNVVIATRVGLGKISLLGQDTAINQDLRGIVPINPKVLGVRFLFWWLKSISDVIVAEGTGATVQGVKLPFVKGLQIPLPPLPEQQRIVALLDEAFEGIATAKAHTEKNLQNARAIFESHLQSVFTQQGDGWVSTTIGESCTLKSGTTVPVSIEKSSGDIPYVKVAEMTLPDNQDGITTSIRFLDRQDAKLGWLIPKGAVIFPKRGGAILTNKKRLVLVDMCADLNIMSVIPSENITPYFLYFYFLTVDMRRLGTGSSIPQINNYDIAPLAISFPKSLSKQAEIAESIRCLESECQALESIYQQKLSALDDLKKSLLHRAFNGDL
jgi:type I restriction enzyme S subunit